MIPSVMKIYVMVFTVFLSLLVSSPLLSASEIFYYDLKWLGIKAGEARIEFREDGDSLIIVSRAQSDRWVSLFYKVDDRAESILYRVNEGGGKEQWKPDRYRIKIREGRHRRNKEAIFDKKINEVLYIDHIKNRQMTYPVPEGTYDTLSAFFLLRKEVLTVGNTIYRTIFDNKKVWNVKIEVLGKEEIETKAGRFSTVVVKPHLESEGIFLKKGDIYIYLSDDERHIPVVLKTKVMVGSVDAELTRLQ
jgi:hypothetical protein